MGDWGCGNFDGDSPRDFLADMVYVWEKIIDHVLAGEMNEAAAYFGPEAKRSLPAYHKRGQEAIDAIVMPTAEVMVAVAEGFECDHLPVPEKVSGWAAEALRVFDVEGVVKWDYRPEERRRVIEGTFDRLSRIAERRANKGAPSDSGPPESAVKGDPYGASAKSRYVTIPAKTPVLSAIAMAGTVSPLAGCTTYGSSG